jgi:hypothetical protein
MVLERGPWAFYQGVKRFIRSSFVEASPGQELVTAASSRISERVAVLADLRERLASVTGQVRWFHSCRTLSRVFFIGISFCSVPFVFHP